MIPVNWIVGITHPADAAGDYGPFDRETALALAAAWPWPASAFPHQLKPGARLAALAASAEEKEGAA